MIDETLYLTTHETALAVVATAMKKARLSLDTLIINSFMGGLLFTSGGMLHVMIVSECPETWKTNPGFVLLLQGLMYPIGLFYVVIMGVDLFNSNILFFLVGLARRAVTVLDLLISWFVSWWFNLVGNIFVCYIISHYSKVSATPAMIEGSRLILDQKAAPAFHETLIKGMAGNFFVCLAIYLQLMAKPLHVKFLMMLLPIFTFVSLGFSHTVADMFVVIIGLINHGHVSVGTVAWKVLLPATLGNIIGGAFFGLVIPWYLHLYVVERDQRKLHLPLYEMRDEQPELNQDSRVVRVMPHDEEEAEEENELEEMRRASREEKGDSDSLNSSKLGVEPKEPVHALYRQPTTRSQRSLRRKKSHKSPANVFPVYGMESPRDRERSIASGKYSSEDYYDTSNHDEDEDESGAEFLAEHLRRTLSRQPTKRSKERERDLESQTLPTVRRQSISTINLPRQLTRFSFASNRRGHRDDLDELNSKFTKAGITEKAANAANEAAGTSDFIGRDRAQPMMMARSQSTVGPTSTSDEGRASTPASTVTVQQWDPSGRSRVESEPKHNS